MGILYTIKCRWRQTVRRAALRGRRPGVQSAEESAGAVFSAAQVLRSGRLRRPLVVIGSGAESQGARLTGVLEENDIPFVLWGTLSSVPTVTDGEEIRLAWIREACDCFAVVGDARAMDAVKAAAARAACRNRTIPELAGRDKVRRKKLPPVLVIPTAAGSGAEALCWATVADDRGVDLVIEDPCLVPPLAVLDPELTADMPREALARSVMDGVCLAVEAYLSGYGDDTSRSLAADALRGLLTSAEPCWNSGGTPEQRLALMSASRTAGEAASAAGYGYARALCRAAARVTGGEPGEILAAVLPAVMEKYGNHALRLLAELSERTDVCVTGTGQEKAAALIGRIRRLAFRLGLPETLSAVSAGTIAEIGDMAAAEANARCSCPVVWTAQECAEVLRSVCAVREQ